MVVVTRFSPGALCKHCGVSSSAAWEESLVYPVCVTVMTEWGRKQKKRMREIRCVSRTTVYNFCLSLSLSPDSLRRVAECRAYSRLRCLCVSLTHECRQQWIAFFWFVCYPVLVPVPVPVPDERRPGNAFPCASTCMYVYRG